VTPDDTIKKVEALHATSKVMEIDPSTLLVERVYQRDIWRSSSMRSPPTGTRSRRS